MPSEMVSIYGLYVVYCKQTCLHDSIRVVNGACFVYFSVLTLSFLHFYILFKISRLYSFIKNKLSKLTKLKIIIPGAAST